MIRYYLSVMVDPRCVAVSSDNHVLVTDRESGKLLLFDAQGKLVTQCSGIVDTNGKRVPFKQPCGVVIDGTDKIAVSDSELNSILVL